MPDSWEMLHGLDPADPSDRNGDGDNDGYTNLEEYLESLLGKSPPTADKGVSSRVQDRLTGFQERQPWTLAGPLGASRSDSRSHAAPEKSSVLPVAASLCFSPGIY
jgi:hypothetical protein